MPLQMLNVSLVGVAFGLGLFSVMYGCSFRRWNTLACFAVLSLTMMLYSGSHAAMCTATQASEFARYFRMADLALCIFFGGLPLLYRQLTSGKAGWVEYGVAALYGGVGIVNCFGHHGLGWESFSNIHPVDMGFLGNPSNAVVGTTPLTYPLLAVHACVLLYCTKITWFSWKERLIGKLLLMLLPFCGCVFILVYAGSLMRFWSVPYALSPVIGSLIYFGLGLTVFDHMRLIKKERELLIHNLSDREKHLKASESRWHQLFDGAADMLFLCDVEGNIRDANRSCCTTLGYEQQEIKTLKIWDLEQDLAVTVFKSRWNTVSQEGVLLLEAQACCSDGRVFPVEMRITPFIHGAETLLFVSSRDISLRKARDVERVRMAEQLRSSSKLEALGRLAGGVAHDFRNLLTVMQANLDLLRWEMESLHSPKCVDSLAKAISRATELTQQLLTFSRHHLVETRLLPMNEVILGMEVILRHCLREDIVLELDLVEVKEQVRIDSNAFEQVLMNLAVNARDAMPEGGTLSIRSHRFQSDAFFALRHPVMPSGAYLVLTIQDNGHGMTPEVKERIFDPFFTTKPRGKGTGLGLAMVFGAIQQMGGCIEVESEPGRGTTFQIYLPAMAPEGDFAVLRDKTSSLAVMEGNLGKNKTVLLVEDETAVREAGMGVLSRMGYRVLIAASGDEALSSYLSIGKDIDLLITDVVMPGMNGRDLAERWSLVHPDTPVLFVSGYTDNILQGTTIEKAGTYFLEKPYSRDSLGKKLQEIWAKAASWRCLVG